MTGYIVKWRLGFRPPLLELWAVIADAPGKAAGIVTLGLSQWLAAEYGAKWESET